MVDYKQFANAEGSKSIPDFIKFTDNDLEIELKLAVKKEAESSLYVIYLLAEVERRRLYSKKCPSLFEYCVTILKYGGGSAQRRIDTMKAMKLIPEIEEKIVTGELSLTVASQAQYFFRQEAKAGKKYSIQEKKNLLQKLENKSTRECVRELVAISPQSVPQDRRKVLTVDKTELKIIADQKLIEKLDKLKGLLSHKKPHLTDGELLGELADMALAKLDPTLPKRKAKTNSQVRIYNKNDHQREGGDQYHQEIMPISRPASKPTSKDAAEAKVKNQVFTQEKVDFQNVRVPNSLAYSLSDSLFESPPDLLPAPEVSPIKVRRDYISKELRREVFKKSHSQCSYPGCKSTYFLEIDHIRPVALGGESTLENLRLLCRTHNQSAAIEIFGLKKMRAYIGTSLA